MKTTTTYLGLVCLLLSSTLSFGQFDNPNVEDFGNARERYLGNPYTGEGTQLIPVGNDLWEGNDVNTIHYGKTPSNSSNKPVLVFVHGYASRASVWFEGRDNMYADVYRDGYRSAYVSLTPNKQLWTNGNMLANAIDKITAHYGVSKVTLVSWSKGGVDTDAAVVHFGANAKVAEVFTLSTPHSGTAIAEWANSILLGLVNIVFMQDNDGTRSLQRGYMNYFRSITNNNANNTVNYTTIGAWGNGPLARLGIPQGLLYADGGSKSSGGNDGVVPYKSSKRPGGLELFGGQRKQYYWWGGWHYPGPSQTELDHFEVTRGGLVWPYIKSRLGNRASRVAETDQRVAENYNPNAIVNSKFQVVTSANGMRTFKIEPNAGKVTILLGQNSENANFRIKGEAGMVGLRKMNTKNLAKGTQTNANLFELENATAGDYTVESDEEFVAFITTEDGIEAEFNTGLSDEKLVYKSDELLNFNLKLNGAKGVDYSNVLVSGTIQRTSDLSAMTVNDEPRILDFKLNGTNFQLQPKGNLPAGIYTVTVNADGGDFKKTVITSIAVAPSERKAGADELGTSTGLEIASAYPNPFVGKLNMRLDLGESGASTLKVFNIYGQEVSRHSFADQTGKVDFTWEATDSNLKAGIYILQLSNGKETITKKVMMK